MDVFLGRSFRILTANVSIFVINSAKHQLFSLACPSLVRVIHFEPMNLPHILFCDPFRFCRCSALQSCTRRSAADARTRHRYENDDNRRNNHEPEDVTIADRYEKRWPKSLKVLERFEDK